MCLGLLGKGEGDLHRLDFLLYRTCRMDSDLRIIVEAKESPGMSTLKVCSPACGYPAV